MTDGYSFFSILWFLNQFSCSDIFTLLAAADYIFFLFFPPRKEFECFKDMESVQKADRQSRQAQDLWEGAMPIKTCATDVLAQIQENFDIHVRPTSECVLVFGCKFLHFFVFG